MRLTPSASICVAVMASACVTINVYFPAAAAEKAADRVIDEVWGKNGAGTAPAEAPKVGTPVSRITVDGVAVALLDFVIPSAHAQGANLDLSSPEIQRLQSVMQSRHSDLLAFYTTGAVGVAADGTIAVRELNLVPLPQRNLVRKLVADENADRAGLYRELARANGHPEWEVQVRDTFAKRWAARAQAGWYVQGAGGVWAQK